jgi:hypothetical protein
LRASHRLWVVTTLGAAAVCLWACRGGSVESGLLAKVGSHELTAEALSAMAGMSVDSLSSADRSRLIQTWVEGALVDEEAKRRGLDHDPEIKARMMQIRAELYRSKLLSALPSPSPSDSAVAQYYTVHRAEFLRPVDAYSLELYWAEHEGTRAQFRDRLRRGDTTMLASGEVSSEGRWLAESRELPEDLEKEISSLKPGEITFPRPYEDGYRVARLLESYPAGTVLDLSAVHDEIVARILLEDSRRRQDSLMTALRERYPVSLFVSDST